MADVDVSYGKLVIIDTYDGPAASVEIAKIAESALAYVDNPNPGVELYTHLTGISAETFYFSNDVFIKHDLTISGNLFFDSLDVSGDSNFKSDINVYNDCSINNNLFVNNLTTFNGRTKINGTLNTQDDCTFEGSSNDIRIQGNFNIGTSFGNPTFKVLSHTGRTTIIGDLSLSEVIGAGKLGSSNNARIAHIDYSKDNYAFQQDNSGVTSINSINGKYITFDISQNEKIRIDGSGNMHFLSSDPRYAVIDISATSAIRIPVGISNERPVNPETGLIRFNTDTSQFEGYNNTNSWQGLGGVIDVNQDTKIMAEDYPTADNNELKFFTKDIERMRIDASGTMQMKLDDPTYIAVDISSTTGIMLPKGTTAQRPVAGGRDTTIRPDISGVIRYNTETQQFEGYATAWQGLGGVIDVDQNTKITAEDRPNDDNNELKFFTAGDQRMIIDASNNIDISTNVRLAGERNVLDVSGATTIHNTLNVLGATAIDNTLDVTGQTTIHNTLRVWGNMIIGDTIAQNGIAELHAPSVFYIDPAIVGDNTGLVVIKGNLQVDGTTTTINSTTVDISDLTIKLAANTTNLTEADGAGIEIMGTGGPSLLYSSIIDSWTSNRILRIEPSPWLGDVQNNISDRARYNLELGLSTGANDTNSAGISFTNHQNYGVGASIIAFDDGASNRAGINFNTYDGVALTEKLRITSGGNVGIGTTSPSTKLEVSNDDIKISCTSGKGLHLYGSSASANWKLLPSTGGYTKMFRIYDFDNTIDRLVINDGGNVGIGTSAPDVNLHVYASSGSWVKSSNSTNSDGIMLGVDAGGTAIVTSMSSTARLDLKTSNTTQLTILNGGNVGIGTASPSEKFHIDGGGILVNNGVSLSDTEYKECIYLGTNKNWCNSIVTKVLNSNPSDYRTFVGLAASSSEGARQVHLSVHGDGNVGIGTTSPAAKLHVEGATGLVVRNGQSVGTTILANGVYGPASQSTDIVSGANNDNEGLFLKNTYSGVTNNFISCVRTSGIFEVQIHKNAIITGTTYLGDYENDQTESKILLQLRYKGSDGVRGLNIKSPEGASPDGSQPFQFVTGNSIEFKCDDTVGLRIATNSAVSIPTILTVGTASAGGTLDVGGNTNVNGHISFNKNVTNYSTTRGIWWHTVDNNDYGIYRETGAWSNNGGTTPYPKLIIKWSQGIYIDGGNGAMKGITLNGDIRINDNGVTSRVLLNHQNRIYFENSHDEYDSYLHSNSDNRWAIMGRFRFSNCRLIHGDIFYFENSQNDSDSYLQSSSNNRWAIMHRFRFSNCRLTHGDIFYFENSHGEDSYLQSSSAARYANMNRFRLIKCRLINGDFLYFQNSQSFDDSYLQSNSGARHAIMNRFRLSLCRLTNNDELYFQTNTGFSEDGGETNRAYLKSHNGWSYAYMHNFRLHRCQLHNNDELYFSTNTGNSIDGGEANRAYLKSHTGWDYGYMQNFRLNRCQLRSNDYLFFQTNTGNSIDGGETNRAYLFSHHNNDHGYMQNFRLNRCQLRTDDHLFFQTNTGNSIDGGETSRAYLKAHQNYDYGYMHNFRLNRCQLRTDDHLFFQTNTGTSVNTAESNSAYFKAHQNYASALMHNFSLESCSVPNTYDFRIDYGAKIKIKTGGNVADMQIGGFTVGGEGGVYISSTYNSHTTGHPICQFSTWTTNQTVFINYAANQQPDGTSLKVAGTSYFGGDITCTGNITAYYSDIRLKTKISTIDNALEKINTLEGFTFKPNQLAIDLGFVHDMDTINVGVSAQEVQKVLPEIVKPAPANKEYLSVQYEKLVPLLIEGIKELTEKVRILEEKLLSKECN